MFHEILVLIRLLDRRTRLLLIAYVFGTFCVSGLDLVGVAAVLPLVQAVQSDGHYSGYMKTLHDLFGDPDQRTFVVYMAAVLVLAFSAKALAALAIKWFSSKFLLHREIQLSTAILLKYQREPFVEHKSRSVPEVFRDVSAATADTFMKVLTGGLSLVTELFTVALVALLLLFSYPWVSIAAALYFGISAYTMQKVLARRNERLSHRTLGANLEVQRNLLQAVHGFREVKLYGLEDTVNGRFRNARYDMADVGRRANFLADIPKYLLEIIFVVGLSLIIVLFFVTSPRADVMSSIGLFAAAGIRILPSITRIVASLGAMRSGRAGLQRTIELLDGTVFGGATVLGAVTGAPTGSGAQERPRNESVPRESRRTRLDATLRATDLHFSYGPGTKQVIDGVDFEVPFGQSLALCGGSGAGKTTLVDIMLGLICPTAGEVSYGPLSVTDDYASWYSRIGYVPQDVFLLDDTIAANVAFGAAPEEIDREKVRECIERTELTELVAELEHGMDTVVGERGTRLSGGQRQRLGIARALYTDPEIVFLDEATSALDNHTERKITETLQRLGGSVTTVMVAHRLSTVRHADQLLFLEQGKVAARGTFEEVERSSPAFAELVRLGNLD